MRTIERRIGLLFAGFLLCFLIVAGRAFWLQGVQGAKLASEAAYQQTEVVVVPGLRGSVLDRFGNPLAVSEEAKTIYATPYQVERPRQTAAKLASILDLEEDEVLESLTEDSGFAYVAHKVDLPSAARVARLELAGIGELPDSRRTYPQGTLAAQTIGAVGDEAQGLTGLEKGKNPVLKGSDGERRVVNDALGEPIRLETVSEASDGEDLRLTLDPAIEEKTEEVLAEVGETYAPKGATAIVMEPRSSELLAIANWPPVDPTDLSSAEPEDLINRATGFTYEPGSTFKAFTVAAALEEGQVSPESYFTLPPTIQVADRVIEESHARGTATMSVAEILAHSSNVGAVTIGLGLGSEKFSRWINRFGFGSPTGMRFPAEEQGIVPALDEYSGSTMGNLPLGQGLAVTPMQMMAAYGAIANGGTLRQPRLVESIGDEALPRACRPSRDRRGRRCPGAVDARRSVGAGRHGLGGQRPRLHPGRQDRDLAGRRKRDLLGDQVRGLVHRLRAGAEPAAARRRDRRPAAGQRLLRRLGCRAGLRQDRGFRSALSRRAAGIGAPAGPFGGPQPTIAAVRLDELVAGAGDGRIVGDPAVEVGKLAYDSRKVKPGTLFFCVPGEKVDGHDFARAAVEAGASGLVVERELDLDVAQVVVPDARAAMAPLAACFYGDPTAELKIVGITGTNGKTTTAFLLREVLELAGMRCGLLGTVKQVVGGVEEEVERTTPEAIDLQGTFRRMLDGGDRACVMEVSSHALALHRCDAIAFDVALFTNLTQDHLDFHGDMEGYFQSKRRLFEMGPGTAIANVDDSYGQRLAEEFECLTFSAAGAEADLVARDVSLSVAGSSFTVGETVVQTRLPGHFNVSNALAAFAAATALGVEPEAAASGLAQAAAPPGRFEPVDEGQRFTVLVDYAHTPDSLENVLRAARRLDEGRVISVFGAGGDRDRGKRPLMGRAGAELSELAIVTSDNPRSEDPEAIVAEILAGIADRDRVEAEVDRRAAIALALSRAEPGDTVVIAGKGHEQGQEFEGGRKVPFDDRDVAREELRKLLGEGQSPAAKSA